MLHSTSYPDVRIEIDTDTIVLGTTHVGAQIRPSVAYTERAFSLQGEHLYTDERVRETVSPVTVALLAERDMLKNEIETLKRYLPPLDK